MTFEVEVAGRTFTVVVERTDGPGRFRVTLDGVLRLVGVSRTGDFGLSLLETRGTVPRSDMGTVPLSAIPLASRDVQVVPGRDGGEVLVGLRGRTIGVTVNGRRSAHAEAALQGHGEVTIVAPMPGRVVRVLVATGDEVDVRQPVVVVEAMKMENELRAPRAGHVKEIAVAPGTSVEAGRVLAVIE
jgi:acetyl/propionyl-CoA carboxylase alpha subunit